MAVLFRYAEQDTFISLRAFDQLDRSKPPRFIRGVRVNGSIDVIVREAAIAAEDAAQSDEPIVFCPPIATFVGPWKAGVADLANGLTLSVELDEGDPDAARYRLEGILGPVTIIVRSGSDWADATTGEVKPKVHLHWRLSEPTTTQDEHDRLRQARVIATLLAGADPTATPVAHPLRWPGSWNLKRSDRPRMATIAVLNEAAEINLGDALEALETAMEAAGTASHADMAGGATAASSTPEARLSDVRSAMAAIPNDPEIYDYKGWVRMGIAVWRATGGAPEGFEIWDNWSRLSDKYGVKDKTEDTWRRIAASMKGPRESTRGAGTIFFLAASAGWVRPFPFGSNARRPANDDSLGADGGAGGEEAPARPYLLSMRDLDARPPPEWLVAGLIPERSLIVPFGPPKSGKTFVVLSFCLHVAAGLPWFGMTVKQGAVVYIAGEGTGGLSVRLRAMRSRHGIEIDVPFWIRERAVNFRIEGEVTELATMIRATVGEEVIAMVVIDTLARAMPGADENSAQEVGIVIAGCDRLRDVLGCAVVAVHHSGKDAAKGARGTSALRGAWDTALEITGTGKRITMTVVDQKEAEAGSSLIFKMEVVSVGIGRTSLVPILDDGDDTGGDTVRFDVVPSGQAGVALKTLRDLMSGPESAILPPLSGLPSDNTLRGVHFEIWRRAFYEKMPGEQQSKRKLMFWRASQKLLQTNLIGIKEPWVWLI